MLLIAILESPAPIINKMAGLIALTVMASPFIWWFVIYRIFPNGMIDYLFWRFNYAQKHDLKTYAQLLEKYFPVYIHLPIKQKAAFLNKIDYLHRKIDFTIDETVNWKKENEIILLAYFVKLILYYPRFNYFSIKEIVVLPTSFYLAYYGNQPLKGLTKKQGEIYLSWKSVLEGIEIGDDGINLLIHEAAHAFMISADHHKNNYKKLINNVNDFFEKTNTYLLRYRTSKPTLIRQYALTNEDEFFACCIELFFEKKQILKAELPELYDDINRVLNYPDTTK
jgi:MtfA peptidase